MRLSAKVREVSGPRCVLEMNDLEPITLEEISEIYLTILEVAQQFCLQIGSNSFLCCYLGKQLYVKHGILKQVYILPCLKIARLNFPLRYLAR